MIELDLLKNAIEAERVASVSVAQHAREVIAVICVDGGVEALQAVSRELYALGRSGESIPERYAFEIGLVNQRRESARSIDEDGK